MESKTAMPSFLGSQPQNIELITDNMTKLPLIILVLFLMGNTYGVFAQEIPNGDMEEWADLSAGNKEFPVGWTTRNHLEANPQANYSLKVNDPYYGDKAILLQNFKPNPEISLASFLSLGAFDAENPYDRGIDFKHRPVSLNFAYKYFTTKADPNGFYKARATIRLTRWDAENNVSVLVADGEYSIDDKTNIYLLVELALEYYQNDLPDSLYISFTTPSNPDDQVRLTLDDIHLGYGTSTSTDIPYYSDDFNLYPNPASYTLNIEQPKDFDESQILVFDAFGRLQIQHNLFSEQEQIDIAALDSGFYYYQILRDNVLVKTGKFLKSIN